MRYQNDDSSSNFNFLAQLDGSALFNPQTNLPQEGSPSTSPICISNGSPPLDRFLTRTGNTWMKLMPGYSEAH